MTRIFLSVPIHDIRGLFACAAASRAVAASLWILAEIFEPMNLRLPNQSVERTGMSRSGKCQWQRLWRLLPVAHLDR
jgi:hypothetical protein